MALYYTKGGLGTPQRGTDQLVVIAEGRKNGKYAKIFGYYFQGLMIEKLIRNVDAELLCSQFTSRSPKRLARSRLYRRL